MKYARVSHSQAVVLQVSDQPFSLMSGGDEFQVRTNDPKVAPGWTYNGHAFAPPAWATSEQISRNNADAIVRRPAAAMRAKGDDVGALTLLLKKGLSI